VIRRTAIKTPISIVPNPANDYVAVKFFTEKESQVIIRLVDNLGKTVLQQTQKVVRGSTVLQLNGLARFGAGVYTVQVFVNNDITTQKLVLSK